MMKNDWKPCAAGIDMQMGFSRNGAAIESNNKIEEEEEKKTDGKGARVKTFSSPASDVSDVVKRATLLWIRRLLFPMRRGECADSWAHPFQSSFCRTSRFGIPLFSILDFLHCAVLHVRHHAPSRVIDPQWRPFCFVIWKRMEEMLQPVKTVAHSKKIYIYKKKKRKKKK